MIFTSPSSSRGDLDEEAILDQNGKQRKMRSKRPSVAANLRMDGEVTVRAIAYAAVQVRLLFPPFLAHTIV